MMKKKKKNRNIPKKGGGIGKQRKSREHFDKFPNKERPEVPVIS